MLAEASVEDEQVEKEWGRDYMRHLFLLATRSVKCDFLPATWQAFWRTSVVEEHAQTFTGENIHDTQTTQQDSAGRRLRGPVAHARRIVGSEGKPTGRRRWWDRAQVKRD